MAGTRTANNGGGARRLPPVLERPPTVDVLTDALLALARTGLPATEETADDVLLGLRGVWARSIDPDDLYGRLKALNDLLRMEIGRIPADPKGRDWALGAAILYGLASGSGRRSLTDRRAEAARTIGYSEQHFRIAVVPKIVRQLARQLYADSQNYIPRSRDVPPRLEPSGDTPTISVEDLSSREKALHEEAVSRLWEYVYGLRAELLAVQRLMQWPDDEHSEEKLAEARMGSLWQLGRLMNAIDDYLEQYGERVTHGEAQFEVRALVRLAGFSGELPNELAVRVRSCAARSHSFAEFAGQM